MIKGCKICGVKDPDTLNFILNHQYPPKFIGFICNYPKSSRYIPINELKKLVNIKKNKIEFVAVLVKPNNEILEEIKNLPFDYYQLYDCTPDEIKIIKQKYQKKIITALTIKDKSDVNKHKSSYEAGIINSYIKHDIPFETYDIDSDWSYFGLDKPLPQNMLYQDPLNVDLPHQVMLERVDMIRSAIL